MRFNSHRARPRRLAAFVLAALAAFATGSTREGTGTTRSSTGESPASPAAWTSFSGSWYATGTRHTVPTEGKRPAAVVRATGNVVIENGQDLSRGFRGEAAYFDDGGDLGVGRAVWTDERGDRIFSELRGERAQTGRRVTGRIIAGTGRYAHLEGEFSMSWEFVIEGEEGAIQGRSADLRGKFRFVEAPR